MIRRELADQASRLESGALNAGNSEEVPLFHAGSVNPTGSAGGLVWHGLGSKPYFVDPDAPAENYNRDLEEYVSELEGRFVPEEWIGKRVLDIGSGAYDRFGREARNRGVHVVSVNPALKAARHRAYLQEARKHDFNTRQEEQRAFWATLPLWRRVFGHMAEITPEKPKTVAAVGQHLPFRDATFDAAVSVYAVPHYLHHVDPTLRDPQAILTAYTPEVREKDKRLITKAFGEIIRVLKPGGKAFLTDDYTSPGQTKQINSFSPSDGTEVREVLRELETAGVSADIHEEIPFLKRSTKRVIVLKKPA